MSDRVELKSPLGTGVVSVPRGSEGRYIERGWSRVEPRKTPARRPVSSKSEK